jgi:hypothetical protein
MSTKRLIDSALEHVRTSASVKTVFGEPVRVDGKTFIPVARMPAQKSVSAPAATKPIGVVEISGTETKFLAFGQATRFAWVASISAAVGLIVGRVFGRRGKRKPGF